MRNNKKKVSIIGTVGLPANYGGFETLASHLVENLDDQYDMTVYCSGKQYPAEDRPSTYRGARLVYLPMQANGVQSILYDALSILHALFYTDVLLILGVAGAWILPFVKLFTKKRIIISIDGIEWKRDKWSKLAKIYLRWAEGVAIKYSHCDISDNESIQDYTAYRYGSLSDVIEYGADHTLQVTRTPEDVAKYPFLSEPYAFKVCRIEPENNMDMVLQSFTTFTEYPLVVVGNWNNSEFGRDLRTKYGHHENLILLDPIYEQRSIDLLRSNALVYIHGHSAGGTNPSLVEAMYLGLPVMAFGICYNRTTTEGKAKYFKDHRELDALLRNTTTDALSALGTSMKEIADRRYRWPLIAQNYQAMIEKAFQISNKKGVNPYFKSYNEETLMELGVNHLAAHRLFFED